MNGLSGRLRQRRADALSSDAEVIRDWQKGTERTEQAEMMIREAMYRRTIGRITHAEESRVFSILAFAMPSNAFVEH